MDPRLIHGSLHGKQRLARRTQSAPPVLLLDRIMKSMEELSRSCTPTTPEERKRRREEDEKWQERKFTNISKCEKNPSGSKDHIYDKCSSGYSVCRYCAICYPFPEFEPSFDQFSNANFDDQSFRSQRRSASETKNESQPFPIFTDVFTDQSIQKPKPVRPAKIDTSDTKRRKEERDKEHLEFTKKDETMILQKVALHVSKCKNERNCLIHSWSTKFCMTKYNMIEEKSVNDFILNNSCIKNERGILIDIGTDYYNSMTFKQNVSKQELQISIEDMIEEINELGGKDKNQNEKEEKLKRNIDEMWSISK
jgi:hypothetical protein